MSNELLKVIKQISAETVESTDPMKIMFGEVTATNPLNIIVDQKLNITEGKIILTGTVKELSTDITFDTWTENSSPDTNHNHSGTEYKRFDITHRHSYMGRKNVTINRGLKVGDKVILIRMQGGQKFIVLDRLVS